VQCQSLILTSNHTSALPTSGESSDVPTPPTFHATSLIKTHYHFQANHYFQAHSNTRFSPTTDQCGYIEPRCSSCSSDSSIEKSRSRYQSPFREIKDRQVCHASNPPRNVEADAYQTYRSRATINDPSSESTARQRPAEQDRGGEIRSPLGFGVDLPLKGQVCGVGWEEGGGEAEGWWGWWRQWEGWVCGMLGRGGSDGSNSSIVEPLQHIRST